MLDDIAKLRAELQILDGRIQIERNDEVRHGLQRGRLEAERAKLLVKMMEAMAAMAVSTAPLVATPTAAPYRVVMQMPTPVIDKVSQPLPNPASLVDARRKRKPDGLPSVAAMIEIVLRDAPGGLRPCDITAAIRQRWWPDLSGPVVSSTVWHMAERGRLAKTGSIYRLPSTSQTNGANGSGHGASVASAE